MPTSFRGATRANIYGRPGALVTWFHSAQLVVSSSVRRWLPASHMLVGPEPRRSDSRSQELLFYKTRPGKGKEWEEVSWIAGVGVGVRRALCKHLKAQSEAEVSCSFSRGIKA